LRLKLVAMELRSLSNRPMNAGFITPPHSSAKLENLVKIRSVVPENSQPTIKYSLKPGYA